MRHGESSMKILQIMAGAKVGGAEAFFERLCIGLHNAGDTQHLAIRRHPQRSNRLRASGLSVQEFPFGGLMDLTTRRGLALAAKKFAPDVALAWMNRGASRMPPGDFVKVARLGGYYDLKYYSRCEYLVANTPDIRDYLVREGWPKDKVHYLPNFVNDEAMPAVDRATLDTPMDAPLLLGLGRLHKNKGFDVAIDALQNVPTAYLWIAGEGPEQADLEARAASCDVEDRVRFLGWREDVPALLAAADIFVCSSRHEPLGNMVIEAWAHGTPVVACEAQGPGQLIQHGATGLLSPIDDADGLARSINTLIEDPPTAQELAQSGSDAFRQAYAEGHVVQQYQDFFHAVTHGRSA